MKITSIALVAMSIVACTNSQHPASVAVAVDIPTLLANPEKYQSKLVMFRGAAVMRFEAQYICPDAVQIDSGRSKECLWLAESFLDGEGMSQSELLPMHGKWVLLTGRFNLTREFNKDFRGHMGAYGGTITPTHFQILGAHGKGDIPPPEPSANNSFKPKPLRGSA